MNFFKNSTLLRPTNLVSIRKSLFPLGHNRFSDRFLAGLFLAGSLLAGCAGAPASAPAADAQPQAETAAQADTGASVTMQDGMKLNINTATEEEFLALPNVGEKMTDEFMEYRPFLSIAQFRQDMSKYVDDAQIAEYEEYLFVPVSANDSDSATLQQLPDVDAALADELIAGRPYADDAAFLDVLAQHLSESEVEEAGLLLEAK